MKKQEIRRYPGVLPFEEHQRRIFLGRKKEVEELFAATASSEITVLFGNCGYGKSSLIEAGLKPYLQENEYASAQRFYPFTIRFHPFHPESNPSVFSAYDFAINSNKQTAGFQLADIELKDLPNTLWGKWKKYAFGPSSALLLIFDQFEEFFSFPVRQQDQFMRQVSSLIYNKYSYYLKKYEADLSPEEIRFIRRPINARIIFSLRSDRISELDRFKRILPLIFQKRVELPPLSTQQAKEAIEQPAQMDSFQEGQPFDSPKFEYRPEAINHLLQTICQTHAQGGIHSPIIEPFLLQVFCTAIESKVMKGLIPDRDKNGLPDVEIEDLPAHDQVLSSYYFQQLENIPEEDRMLSRLLIEDALVKTDVRGITYRDSVDERNLMAEYEANGLTTELLTLLVDKYLLRRTQNSINGFSYELSHDVLLAPVMQAKQEREAAQLLRHEVETQTKIISRENLSLKTRNQNLQGRVNILQRIGMFALSILLLIAVLVAIRQSEKRKLAEIDNLVEKKKLVMSFAQQAQFEGDHTFSFRLAESAWRQSNVIDSLKEEVWTDSNVKIDSIAGAIVQQLFNASTPFMLYDCLEDYGLSSQETWPNRNGVAISQRGRRLATVDAEGGIKVFRLYSGTSKEEYSFANLGGFQKPSVVRMSPSGRYLVRATAQGMADLADLKEVESDSTKAFVQIRNAGSAINTVAFSPQEDFLIIGSKDGYLTVHNLRNNQMLGRTKLPIEGYASTQQAPIAIEFLSDRVFAVATDGRAVMPYSISYRGELLEGDQEYRLEGNTAIIAMKALMLGGRKHLFIGFASGIIRYCSISHNPLGLLNRDTRDRYLVKKQKGEDPEPRYTKIVFRQDTTNQVVAYAASMEGSIEEWSPSRKSKLLQGQAHDKLINNLIVSPAGKYLASASADGTVKVWTTNGDLLSTLYGHDAFITPLAYSELGNGSLITGTGSTIRRYSRKVGTFRRDNLLVGNTLTNMRLHSAKGDLFLTGTNPEREFEIYSYPEGERAAQCYTFEDLVDVGQSALTSCLSPDSSENLRLAVSLGGEITIFQEANGEWEPAEVQGFGRSDGADINSLDFAQAGHYLLSNSDSSKVFSFNLNETRDSFLCLSAPYYSNPLRLLRSYDTNIDFVNPQKRNSFFVVYPDDVIRWYAIDTTRRADLVGSRLEALDAVSDHVSEVTALEVCHGNSLLLTGSSDQTIRVYDIKFYRDDSHQLLLKKILKWPNAKGNAVSFSADGQYVVSGGQNGEIYIYDLGEACYTNCKPTLTLKESTEGIIDIQMMPGNEAIVYTTESGAVYRKPICLDVGKILRLINEEEVFGAVRRLTKAEQAEFGLEE